MLSVPASRLRSELEALGMVSVHASVDTEAVHFAPDDKQIIQVRLPQALPALPRSMPPAQAMLQQLPQFEPCLHAAADPCQTEALDAWHGKTHLCQPLQMLTAKVLGTGLHCAFLQQYTQ